MFPATGTSAGIKDRGLVVASSESDGVEMFPGTTLCERSSFDETDDPSS